MRKLIWPAVIAVAAVAAYSNTFSVPFIFDDIESIVENPQIREPLSCWTRIDESRQLAVSGRPLVCWTLGINYAISGLKTWSYHAGNLAIHIAAALTLYGLIRRTALRHHRGECGGQGARLEEQLGIAPEVLAGITATIWAVHPLQTESVTYVMQRTENLCGLLLLLTMYCCVRAWEGEDVAVGEDRDPGKKFGRGRQFRSGGQCPPYEGRGSRSHNQRIWEAVAVVCCMLGVFCKELIAVVPLLVLLYDRTFVSGSFGRSIRRHWGVYLGLAASWPVLIWLNSYGPRTDSIGFHLGMTPLMYLRTQASVLIHYLRLTFWPDALVVSYFDWPIAWGWRESLPSGLAILGMLGIVVAGVWENRWWGFVGTWFFVLLAPTSSVVPIVTEIAAERRMYLPLAAVILAGVVGFAASARGKIRTSDTSGSLKPAIGPYARFGAWIVFIAVVAALGGRTVARNSMYQSELRLWTDAAGKRPGNPLVRCALGSALDDDGKHAEALEEYQEALRLNAEARRVQSPTLAEALYYNMGRTLASLGRTQEAIAAYREALRLKPRLARAHNNLAALLTQLGRFDEARGEYEQALREAPQSANARNNFGVFLAQQGKVVEAIEAFREAVRLDPRFADAWQNLGRTLVTAKQWAEAEAALEVAVKLRPEDAEIRSALEGTRSTRKRPAEPAKP